MVFGGIPVGIDSDREDMDLNPNSLEVLKVKEVDPMWSSESSNLDWLFEEG